MLQVVLPRRHHNVIFFYLAISSMMLTGNVTSVKPLLCCKMCQARSQLTDGQHIHAVACPPCHCTAPSPLSQQENQAKARDVLGQTAAETCLENLAPAAASTSNGQCRMKARTVSTRPVYDTSIRRDIFNRWHPTALLEDGTETTGWLQRKRGHFS